jgi:hypothetical protein
MKSSNTINLLVFLPSLSYDWTVGTSSISLINWTSGIFCCKKLYKGSSVVEKLQMIISLNSPDDFSIKLIKKYTAEEVDSLVI